MTASVVEKIFNSKYSVDQNSKAGYISGTTGKKEHSKLDKEHSKFFGQD